MEKLSEAKVLVNDEWIELRHFSSNEEWLQYGIKKAWLDDGRRPVVTRWENAPECLSCLNYVPSKIFELIRRSSKADDTCQEGFMIWLERHQSQLMDWYPDTIYNRFLVDYQGYYHSEAEFAGKMVDDLTNMPDTLKVYFDEKKFADHLFSTDYEMINNHVFFK